MTYNVFSGTLNPTQSNPESTLSLYNIVSRFAGKHLAETRLAEYFDVAAGREAPRWVGWTCLDGRASWMRLLLIGFEYQQTKRTIP